MKTEMIKTKLTELYDKIEADDVICGPNKYNSALAILDRLIEIDRSEAPQDAKQSEQPLAEEETYSIGDRFRRNDHKSILVSASEGIGLARMVFLSDGEHWGGDIAVGSCREITKAEFDNNWPRFIRYWDFQQQCKC
jgi:hypothetical protein